MGGVGREGRQGGGLLGRGATRGGVRELARVLLRELRAQTEQGVLGEKAALPQQLEGAALQAESLREQGLCLVVGKQSFVQREEQLLLVGLMPRSCVAHGGSIPVEGRKSVRAG